MGTAGPPPTPASGQPVLCEPIPPRTEWGAAGTQSSGALGASSGCGCGQAQSHEALTPQVMPWVFSMCGVWITSGQAGHGHQGDARGLWWPPWAGAAWGLRPQHRPPAHGLPSGPAGPTAPVCSMSVQTLHSGRSSRSPGPLQGKPRLVEGQRGDPGSGGCRDCSVLRAPPSQGDGTPTPPPPAGTQNPAQQASRVSQSSQAPDPISLVVPPRGGREGAGDSGRGTVREAPGVDSECQSSEAEEGRGPADVSACADALAPYQGQGQHPKLSPSA